ncbi:Uncharacterised protein [Shigella sonnei]|nr:Uncharacterised protein [Shigella sonnei]
MRQFADFFRIAVAFHHLTNLLLRALYIHALTEHHAKTAVTRLVVGTGKHQIAQPRHAHKGGRIGTQRRAKTRHFSQPTGDQCRTRIRTKTDTVGHPRANGNDVFHRTAKLHTDEIRVAVNAETFATVQQLLEIIGKGLVGRGQRNSRR